MVVSKVGETSLSREETSVGRHLQMSAETLDEVIATCHLHEVRPACRIVAPRSTEIPEDLWETDLVGLTGSPVDRKVDPARVGRAVADLLPVEMSTVTAGEIFRGLMWIVDLLDLTGGWKTDPLWVPSVSAGISPPTTDRYLGLELPILR